MHLLAHQIIFKSEMVQHNPWLIWDGMTLDYKKAQYMDCKFALGVNCYSSNHACRAELGKVPLSIKLWTVNTGYGLRVEDVTVF